jgi:hypothetical protein
MMVWAVVVWSGLAAAVVPAGAGSSAGLDLSRHVAYPVLLVMGGDTVVVKSDSGGVALKLRGVEANREGAKAFLRGLLERESVHVVYAPQGARDWAGHLSAYLFRAGDKLFVNQEIVSRGFGVTNRDTGPHERLFTLIEESARFQKRGLWKDTDISQLPEPSPLAVAERAKTIEHSNALRERWRNWNNAVEIAALESELAEQRGTSILTVKNDRQAKLRVTMQGGLRPVSFIVPAGSSRSVALINGQRYLPVFRFADEPGAIYQGDPVFVDDNDPTVTVGVQHDGNYHVRKVH